jgi:hypothetical protein
VTASAPGRFRYRLLATLCVCVLFPTGVSAAADLADFKSDGCSLFPDGSYYSCCYLHDFAYWPGGTADQRKAADDALRACVREITGGGFRAGMMFYGVRMGGGPGRDTSYRWGFGWPFPYREEYGPLTVDELKQVAEKTRKLCESLRLDPVTGGYVVDVDKEISAAQARQICPALPSPTPLPPPVRY